MRNDMRLVSILSLLVVVLARALSTAGQLPADPQRKKPGPDRVTVVTTHVSGVVTDKSGAVLPNVQVTLRLPDGSIRTKLTDVEGRDRKSTRLNSSHVEISYAVFCLKKK